MVEKSLATPHFFVFARKIGNTYRDSLKKCANIRGNIVYNATYYSNELESQYLL